MRITSSDFKSEVSTTSTTTAQLKEGEKPLLLSTSFLLSQSLDTDSLC